MEFNLETDTASNGYEAQAMIKERHRQFGDCYVLILMDYSMPGCNGPETVKGILEYLSHYPEVKKPYISCITAYENEEFKMKAINAGMNEVIGKLVSKQKLGIILRKVEIIPA